MNLNDYQQLFETQRKLDERINKEFNTNLMVNRIDKKILALQVELGETANEWRGFKFWSKDREPRTHKVRTVSDGYRLNVVPYNPLLEETVDVLHFILSLGAELNFDGDISIPTDNFIPEPLVAFSNLFYFVSKFYSDLTQESYNDMFAHYEKLFMSLGFNKNTIVEAYYEKNKINHQRQDGGY